MSNLLNVENDFYYGIGDGVSSTIEMFPKEKRIELTFQDGTNFYQKNYSFSNTKKAHWFCNRIVRDFKKATKRNACKHFGYYDSINKNRYELTLIYKSNPSLTDN